MSIRADLRFAAEFPAAAAAIPGSRGNREFNQIDKVMRVGHTNLGRCRSKRRLLRLKPRRGASTFPGQRPGKRRPNGSPKRRSGVRTGWRRECVNNAWVSMHTNGVLTMSQFNSHCSPRTTSARAARLLYCMVGDRRVVARIEDNATGSEGSGRHARRQPRECVASRYRSGGAARRTALRYLPIPRMVASPLVSVRA
jgi:hypothetical protein